MLFYCRQNKITQHQKHVTTPNTCHNTKNMSQHQTRSHNTKQDHTTPKTCHNTKQDHTTPKTCHNTKQDHTTHNTKNMSQFIYFTFSFVCFFCFSSVNIFKVKLAVSFCYLSVISDICEPCLEGGGFNIPYT